MGKIQYYILYAYMWLHAILPFRVLYVFSDILYYVVYHLVGYRVKVVRRNLAASFPDKSAEELKKIEKDFYHNLCDYYFETIKLLHISDKEILKRMKFHNLELVEELSKDGNSVLMYLGHYGNWEWIPSLMMHLGGTNFQLGQIYRPLKNKAFDRLFLKIRSRFNTFSIAKDDTFRAIIRKRRDGIQTMIGFMADQTPSVMNIHYWTTFLNQETPFFNGVERIAKQTGFYVCYLDVQKVERGYYEATVRMISDNPKEEPEFAITEKYARAMEKTILRNPAYWLWSHKRWKRKREDVERQQQEIKHRDK